VKQRIVLLGPPASGKGTQAEMIRKQFGIPTASPGAMLREEKRQGTALGLDADKLTAQGQLLPDEIIVQIVSRWFDHAKSEAFVLDGFPRTLGQATALEDMLSDRGIPLELVLALEADPETLAHRVENRLVCQECRQIVSIGLHVVGPGSGCPSCGGKLIKRADDSLETLKLRMVEYESKTEPLINFYAKRNLLARVDTTADPETVFEAVKRLVAS
jgi:adenylate kinase